MVAASWNASAATYRGAAEHISFYRETNRHLAAAAGLRPGMVVVDLACGTGLTTRAVLAAVHGVCTVYAVDLAEGMLREAEQSLSGAPVHFVHASAEAFAHLVPVPADRVLSNAAFWHFPDPVAVLGQVRAVLTGDGRYLFNIPDQAYDFGDGRRSQMAQVVAAAFGYPQSQETAPYAYATVEDLAVGSGFRIADYRVIEVPVGRDDLIRFYSIPHVASRHFPAYPADMRPGFVAEAFGRLALGAPVPYRWAQFSLALAAHPRTEDDDARSVKVIARGSTVSGARTGQNCNSSSP